MTDKRRSSAPETSLKIEIPGLREHLNRSDLFSSCSKQVQDSLLSHFHFRHFGNGEYLIQSGNKASTMFILLKGKVQIISDKYESVLAELGPGMIFGEIGALFGVPRIASVITKSAGLVAVIDKMSLKQIIGSDRILWNHLKGIALSRYMSTSATKAASPHVLAAELADFLVNTAAFKDFPEEIINKFSELAVTFEYKAEIIVDFFSPRAKHVLYIVKEGTVQASHLDGTMRTFTAGDTFTSYDDTFDFVKTITEKTVLIILDVQDASVIVASHDDPKLQEIGESLFGVAHLTDNIDANSSLTTAIGKQFIGGLNSLVNPSQFSRRRRNSFPIFSDLGKENGSKFIGVRHSISAGPICDKIAHDDGGLKGLLSNAGIIVPDEITLLFEDRLTLTPIKNELNDSILLLILAILGSNLKVLNLTDCHLLTSSGILAIWLRCPELAKISLQGCWNLDDSAFSTLARCRCAETLKEINISHCWRMTSKVLSCLGPNITKLDLSYCKGFDDLTWPALTPFSGSLRSLRLRRCYGITDNSFEGLFGVQFDELELLDLCECSFLTDSAVSTILSSAPNLRNLNISFAFGISGSFLLSPNSSLPNLRILNLSRLKDVVNETFCIRLGWM